MDEPLVSVLMSVYNARSEELRQSIDSILNQTFGNFEFIIINDGSTNETEKVIQSYSDARIRYYKNETNLKIITSLNNGLKLCRGKYIARLDSDDYSGLTRLEKQVDYMEKHPNVGGLGTFFKRLHTGEEIKLPTEPADVNILSKYVRGCISNPSGMIRKSVLDKNNLIYDKNCLHAEDFKLWADISYHADLAVIPEVLTFIRSHEDGVSRTNIQYQAKMVTIVLLDNMIRDFECDKKYLYSVLIKYIKGLAVTQKEFNDIKQHILFVANYVINKVSPEYKNIVLPHAFGLLNRFIVN